MKSMPYISLKSWVVIFSKVADCTSQPVVSMDTWALIDVWQASEKADQITFGSGIVVYVIADAAIN